MTTVPEDVTSMLAKVFAANAADRQRRYDALLETLTVREKLIFRDAAIAGFVQGTRFAGLRHDADFPKDQHILTEALSAITSFPDLYPTVSGYAPDEEGE